MSLHILTLTWNGINHLKNLEPGLFKVINGLGNANWYVRDNGSKDGSVDWLKERSYIKLLEAGHNRDNFSQCVNSLYKFANPQDGDLILLLNNDVVIKEPVSISKMIGLQKDTGADIVGARLLYKGTNKLQHAGVIFSQRYNTLPFHFRPGEESDKSAMKNRWFQAVTAACMLTTKEAFEKNGAFDEGFVWSFEDIDYCLKSNLSVKKIVYCGETEIEHEESSSLKKNPVNKMFVSKNVARFREKWSGKYEIDHEKYLSNPNYNVI